MQIIYEPHPVSPERKEYLRQRGYKIVDAVFAPAGWVSPEDEPQPQNPLEHDGRSVVSRPDALTPRKRGRPRKGG